VSPSRRGYTEAEHGPCDVPTVAGRSAAPRAPTSWLSRRFPSAYRSRYFVNRKKIVLTTLKSVAPIALIAWLLSQIDPSRLEQLRRRPLDLPRLGGAFAVPLTSV